MRSTQRWQRTIRRLWQVVESLFIIERNFSASSHIHVAPIGRRFTLRQLKTIGFAIAFYEPLVLNCLANERRGNRYCIPNSRASSALAMSIRSQRPGQAVAAFQAVQSRTQLRDLMQGGERTVLWNFLNTVGHDASGTIEFRGGRHLRGRRRSCWWIAFVLAFVSMALEDVRNFCPSPLGDVITAFLQPSQCKRAVCKFSLPKTRTYCIIDDAVVGSYAALEQVQLG